MKVVFNIKLLVDFNEKQKAYVLSKQILKAGTSVGANIHESQFAQSKLDFINKLSISLKEANETQYWLHLLNQTEKISDNNFKDLYNLSDEIIRLLVSSIKTAKLSLTNNIL